MKMTAWFDSLTLLTGCSSGRFCRSQVEVIFNSACFSVKRVQNSKLFFFVSLFEFAFFFFFFTVPCISEPVIKCKTRVQL